MDFLRLGILFLTVIAIFVMRTYFKKTWDMIQLPLLIVLSILSVFLVLVILYAGYAILFKTSFSIGEKIIYCFLDAGIVVAFVWLNIASWKRWKNEHERKK